MKIFATVLLALLVSTISFGQEKVAEKLEYTLDRGCGDPMTESNIYTFRSGKVIAVSSDNELSVAVSKTLNAPAEDDSDTKDNDKQANSKTFTVTIVGVSNSVNKKEINSFLRTNLLGKDVTITGNTKSKASTVAGLVQFDTDEELEDVSEYLLERGLAKFKDLTHPNLVPMTTVCLLKKAEKRAMDAKLGVWSSK